MCTMCNMCNMCTPLPFFRRFLFRSVSTHPHFPPTSPVLAPTMFPLAYFFRSPFPFCHQSRFRSATVSARFNLSFADHGFAARLSPSSADHVFARLQFPRTSPFLPPIMPPLAYFFRPPFPFYRRFRLRTFTAHLSRSTADLVSACLLFPLACPVLQPAISCLFSFSRLLFLSLFQ